MSDITILLPIYNEKVDYVENAVSSILKQTMKDIIIFITLDNPDNYILKNFILELKKKDSRIIFTVNSKNMGLPATLNSMLDNVKTPYIARMDGDDIADEDRIRKQYMYMQQHPEVDLCGTNIEYIDIDGKSIGKNNGIPRKTIQIEKCLKYKNCIAHPTFFAKTKMMKSVKYRDTLKYAQDYDFVCRCVEKGYSLANLDEYLLKYRVVKLNPEKLVRQNMTAYYVRKLYRKRRLAQTENIAFLIDCSIKKYGQSELERKASIKQSIQELRKMFYEKDRKMFLRDIYDLCVQHPYKIDGFISNCIYRILIRKEQKSKNNE